MRYFNNKRAPSVRAGRRGRGLCVAFRIRDTKSIIYYFAKVKRFCEIINFLVLALRCYVKLRFLPGVREVRTYIANCNILLHFSLMDSRGFLIPCPSATDKRNSELSCNSLNWLNASLADILLNVKSF